MIEVVKSIIFLILGLILGIAVCSGAELWLVICTVVVVIMAVAVADIFIIMKQKNKRKPVSYGVMSSSSSSSGVRQDARISREPQRPQVKEAQELKVQESKPQVTSSAPAVKTQKS